MESQSKTLTAKPLRTSNDSIFPSLHPFGPFYGQRNLLQKRTSDVLVSQSSSLEQTSKLHVISQPGGYRPVRTLSIPQGQPIKTPISKIVPQRKIESKPVNGFGLGLSDIWGQLLGVNLGDKLQVNLMMEMMKQQMNALADQALQQIAMGKVQEFSPQAKSVESMITVSDSSSTVESENEEEIQFTKENQGAQGKEEQKMEAKLTLVLNPLQERQLNGECVTRQDANDVKKSPLEENNIIEKTKEKITMMTQEPPSEEKALEPEETGLPGFDDKIKSPVSIDVKVQAVIPGFKTLRTDEEVRRVPKLIWIPEEEKIEEIKVLLVNLSETLGCEITHEQRAWRLYQRYEFSMEKCLEVVGRQKNKYKADFKYKRASNKKLRIA